MRRFFPTIVAATVVVSTLFGGVAAARENRTVPVSYLALGDSLAAGFQPDGTTGQGYVHALWRSMGQQVPGLDLRNVGCGGETSRSLITGDHSPCTYAAGSQLDAAVAYLGAHPGGVAFITIDIGANDVLYACADGRTWLIDKTCVAGLLPRLKARVSTIVAALAAAAPGVPIVGMTYYDPFLGLWGSVPGGYVKAHTDQRAWSVLNGGLASAYREAGVTVADVAATFRIDDFTHTVVFPGRGRIPVNVARACGWTWFCSVGDVHADRKGYAKIALTFERKLGRLLP